MEGYSELRTPFGENWTAAVRTSYRLACTPKEISRSKRILHSHTVFLRTSLPVIFC